MLSNFNEMDWKIRFPNFTREEVAKHGDLSKIEIRVLYKLQELRSLLRVPISIIAIIKESTWHKNGHAIDFVFNGKLNGLHVNELVELMLTVGFTGIGVYWNGVAWSFHGDVRPNGIQLWTGIKGRGVIIPAGQPWYYQKMCCTFFPVNKIP